MLLVEDNPTDVFVVKEVLAESGLGLTVEVATDGEAALRFLAETEEAERGCPALVLLDLNLPRVDGFEVLRRMRSGGRCKDIPVIVVSSSNVQADYAAARRFGAAAYFQKPAELEAYMALSDLIRQVLGRE